MTLTDKLLDTCETLGLTVCRTHGTASPAGEICLPCSQTLYCTDHRYPFALALGECPACVYERTFVSSPEVGDDVECDKHGVQQIADEFSFSGYAGGRCFGFELSCGCTSLDESNDVAAAY